MKTIENYTVTAGKCLLLRTINADYTSYNGFKWPKSVGKTVTAKDWYHAPVCGGGIHGLMWGIGGVNYLSSDESAIWQLVEATESECVSIDGDKHKAQSVLVVAYGSKDDIIRLLDQLRPDKSRTGVFGTATAGVGGTATAGDYGTATAGDYGTATAGERGTATAGVGGTATAGVGGIIVIEFWNGKRYKTRVAHVKDEDGDGQLEPNTPYKLDDNWNFIKA